jgi:hypothetical protein
MKRVRISNEFFEIVMSEEEYESVKVMCKRYDISESYYFLEFDISTEVCSMEELKQLEDSDQ